MSQIGPTFVAVAVDVAVAVVDDRRMPRTCKGLLPLILAGCAATIGARSAPRVQAREYYPLEPGAVWVYRANYFGQEQTRTVVMGPKQDGFYVDDAGGKLLYDGEGLRDERRYLLREPLEAGNSWRSVAALGATETYTIVKAHAPCETKARRFDDCVEVKSSMSALDKDGREAGILENTMVFAKQTGLVRLFTVLTRGEQRTPQIDMELIDFKRAGGRP